MYPVTTHCTSRELSDTEKPVVGELTESERGLGQKPSVHGVQEENTVTLLVKDAHHTCPTASITFVPLAKATVVDQIVFTGTTVCTIIQFSLIVTQLITEDAKPVTSTVPD